MKNDNILFAVVVILFATALFLVACSDDDSTNQSDDQSTTDENTVENNNNASSDDKDSNGNKEDKDNSDGNKEEETNKNEHIEHQYGLKIGGTGTVVSYTSNNLDDSIRYEVTLNDVQYEEDVEVNLFNEVYVVVDVTIKNIDDKVIDLSNISTPSFGELGTNDYTSARDYKFVEIPGINKIEGDLQPGESITGNYVFDVNKADNYHFAVGTRWDQIVTLAEWELSAEEIK